MFFRFHASQIIFSVHTQLKEKIEDIIKQLKISLKDALSIIDKVKLILKTSENNSIKDFFESLCNIDDFLKSIQSLHGFRNCYAHEDGDITLNSIDVNELKQVLNKTKIKNKFWEKIVEYVNLKL